MFTTKKKLQKFYPKSTQRLFVRINNSDISLWKKIKGIGSKRASQIIKYRQLLRGFININQIKEVYSINDSFFD